MGSSRSSAVGQSCENSDPVSSKQTNDARRLRNSHPVPRHVPNQQPSSLHSSRCPSSQSPRNHPHRRIPLKSSASRSPLLPSHLCRSLRSSFLLLPDFLLHVHSHSTQSPSHYLHRPLRHPSFWVRESSSHPSALDKLDGSPSSRPTPERGRW